jgi:calcium permeable stress-gated cation channel
MITRECIYYINLRQAFLMSPIYANRMSSRTVLFTSVPDYYLNEARLRSMLGKSVVRVWIPTDTKELDDLVKERDKISLKLEGAETKLCKLANEARLKALKGGHTPNEEQAMAAEGAESGSVAARWIRPKDRPTHRLKPLIGKKVDTIDWSRAELEKLIPKVREEQAKHRSLEIKKINAVFVEFDSVSEAQAAYQSLTHHQVSSRVPVRIIAISDLRRSCTWPHATLVSTPKKSSGATFASSGGNALYDFLLPLPS